MWLTRPDARGALNDPGVKEALPRYVDIVTGKKNAKSKGAYVPADRLDVVP